ncbi:MAG TPA: hypothetical protein VFZ91_16710 [Allosphingosinicella sp.]
MKRLILVAAGGLLLATAGAPPPTTTAAATHMAGAYPPCSAKVTDRCTQTYERGMGRHDAAAPQPRAGSESELSSVVAAEAPQAAPAPARHYPAPTAVARHDYPRCSATVTDRCVQGRARAAHPAPREVQLAMRAGERG